MENEKEKNKIKVYMTISIVTFLGSVLLFIAEFICKSMALLSMSNMKFMTDLPTIWEPPLVIASGACFAVSLLTCARALWLLWGKKKESYDDFSSYYDQD